MTAAEEVEFLACMCRIERGEATANDAHWLKCHEANLRQSIVLLQDQLRRLKEAYQAEVQEAMGVLPDD